MVPSKQKNRFKRLLRSIKNITPPPKQIQIVPTNKCNVNCIFCWRAVSSKDFVFQEEKDRISEKRLKRLVKESCNFNPNTIILTGGGEPLLKKDFILEGTKESKKHDIEGRIITNGTLFDKKLVKNLVDVKWDFVNLSVNASTPNLDDFLRGKKGSHKQVLKGIGLFNKWKKNLKSSSPRLEFNMVITKHNWNNVCDMVKLADEQNIGALNVRLVIEPSYKGKPGPLCLTRNKYEKFIEELNDAEKLAKSKGIVFRKDFSKKDLKRYLGLELREMRDLILGNDENQKEIDETLLKDIKESKGYEVITKYASCTFPFYELHINSNGHVACCGTFASGGETKSKQVTEKISDKTLSEIWYGEKFNRLRVLSLLNHLPKECSDCNVNLAKMAQRFREALDLENED